MIHRLTRTFWRFGTELWGLFMRLYRKDTRPAEAIGYRDWAERNLSRFSRDFIFTPNRNRPALDRISFVPRVARDVTEVKIQYEIFGLSLPSPIGLAPTGSQMWLHPAGERATAAGLHGHLGMIGSMASQSVETIVPKATGPLWFQLYLQHDDEFNEYLISKVLALGFSALCVTLDTPVASIRPGWAKYKIPAWAVAPNLRGTNVPKLSPGIGPRLSPSVTWRKLELIKKRLGSTPLILKGILHIDDAKEAENIGADAILVSNHGGRQLFGSISPVEVFQAIRNQVSVPLFLDGGITSGIDVLKALALGAEMAFVGSSYLCALAHSGADGVEHLLQLMDDELIRAMRLVGVTRLQDINESLLGAANGY